MKMYIGFASVAAAVAAAYRSFENDMKAAARTAVIGHLRAGRPLRNIMKLPQSKYVPHQAAQEIARRVRQMLAGMDCGQWNEWRTDIVRQAGRLFRRAPMRTEKRTAYRTARYERTMAIRKRDRANYHKKRGGLVTA